MNTYARDGSGVSPLIRLMGKRCVDVQELETKNIKKRKEKYSSTSRFHLPA